VTIIAKAIPTSAAENWDGFELSAPGIDWKNITTARTIPI